MSDKYLALAVVLVWAAANCDLPAHRDELASRRFRRLSGDVVQDDLDKSRNRRWHRLGLIQRVLSVLPVAVIAALWLHTWRAALGGAWVGGFLVAAGFDVVFNRRIGNPLFYLGGTAKTDVFLAGFIAGATNEAGRWSFLAKLTVAALGVIFWVFFV